MKDKSISVLLPSHEVLKGGAICQGFVTLYSSVLFIPQVAPIGDSFQVQTDLQSDSEYLFSSSDCAHAILFKTAAAAGFPCVRVSLQSQADHGHLSCRCSFSMLHASMVLKSYFVLPQHVLCKYMISSKEFSSLQKCNYNRECEQQVTRASRSWYLSCYCEASCQDPQNHTFGLDNFPG